MVGWFIAKITKTPKNQIRAVIASCGFGNSTGLPITLLTVVHENFPSTSDLGRIDPSLFLSVYLLLYPALQWGIGGWLLTPNTVDDDEKSCTGNNADHLRMSVLNNKHIQDFYNQHRHGLSSIDECLYVSEL
jgi:predicted permease